MSFDPYNCPLKIWESIRTPTPRMGVHLGMCGFILSHFPTLSRAWNMTFKLSLLAHTFASPCPGREPKARVVIRSKLLVRNDSPMGLWAIHYISWWPPWHLGYGPHPTDLEFHNQYQDHLILLIHYVNSHIMVLTIYI